MLVLLVEILHLNPNNFLNQAVASGIGALGIAASSSLNLKDVINFNTLELKHQFGLSIYISFAVSLLVWILGWIVVLIKEHTRNKQPSLPRTKK
jgi:hypothetical protein